MADYSREDSEYAERIVNRLISREVEGMEIEPGLAVSDVEENANVFSDELAFLEQFDAEVPAAKVADEKVPVSLQVALGDYYSRSPFPPFGFGKGRPWRGHPFFYEEMYDTLRYQLRERRFNGFTSMDRQEARTTFQRRAVDFVATRVSAVRDLRNNEPRQPWHRATLLNIRQSLLGSPAPTPGCHFTVSTNSSGLRVFWSGAYYVTPNNFNSPTTPTTSVLQSGTYLFGVDGGAYGNTIQWDLNLVVTLPGPPYAHLNF
jgi:hypothetical protein